jgi:PAS domain S-box-containing protein
MNPSMPPIEFSENPAKAESALNKFYALSLDLFYIRGENGYFQQLNPVWEDVLGWTATDLLHTPWQEWVHPHDVDKTLTSEKQLSSNDIVEYQNRYRHKDGSYRSLSWRVSQAEDGLVYGVGKDITAELKLRESERRFHGVFNQTFQFFSLLNLDGTMVEDNQTALDFCQLQREQIIGHPFWELRCWTISPETQDQLKQAIAQAAQGNIVRYETNILAPDHSVLTIDFSLQPLKDETGQIELLMAEGRDITAQKQAESKLQKTERRFNAVFNQTFQFSSLLSPDGRTVQDNQTAIDFCQLQREEIIGHPFWQIPCWSLSQETQNQLQQAIAQAAQGTIVRYETDILTPDGSIITIDFSLKPIKDATGQIELLIAEGRDITERKKSEEALRLSEQRFRVAVDNFPGGLVIYDANRRFLFVNALCLKSSGLSESDLLGKTDEEVFGFEIADAYLPFLQKAVETRTAQTGECVIEIPTGGSSFFLVNYVPLLDEKGEIYQILGIAQDIGDRKRAEAQLQNAYQQLTLLVDNSPLAILEWDSEFHLQRWSKQAEQIFGWKADELLHQHPSDWRFVYEPDKPMVDHILNQLMQGTIQRTVDKNRNYTKDGKVLYCEWYNSALFDESGHLVSILSLVLDVTERKQAEAQLQQVMSELEMRVEERTFALQQANEQLSAEIAERQQATAALRQSEEQFRRVFEEAPIGMALTTPEKNFFRVNQALVEMLGYSESELADLTCEAITHPEDWKRILPYLEQVARGELDRYQIEERFFKKNREIVWGNLTSMMLRSESGEILYGLGMVEDITERRQAEAALRQSEEQFRRVFDEAPIGMSLAGLDDQYIRVNRAFFEMLGYTQSELMALTFVEITHPEDLELEIPYMDQLIKGEIDSFALEKRYLTKQQTVIWVNLTLIALRDHEGAVLYTLAMVEDITERKQAEQALQQSEARYRAIVEDQTELICRFLADGTLTFVNDAYCRYFNKQRSELIGHNFMPVIPEEDQEAVTQKFASLSVEQPIVTYEHRIILRFGEVRWQQWTDRALFNDSGELVEFQAVGRDITKLKQAEAEILKALERERELSELRSSFVSLVSHEFRTPLTTIQSSTELLERYTNKLSDERKYNHYRRIQDAVKRMTQLLEDVLTIGKAEAGKLKFEPSELDLLSLCHDLVEGLQISAQPHHKIDFITVGDVGEAYMDERLLGHILNNLLSNAIKYSPNGGTVRFDLIGDRTSVMFRIQDNGIGIPPQDRESLFESFGRASNVGAIPGTGLGLAIVKKCVDLHGGTITVESEVGLGTTFIITLPLKFKPAVVANSEAHSN